jgi:hypothetical protein
MKRKFVAFFTGGNCSNIVPRARLQNDLPKTSFEIKSNKKRTKKFTKEVCRHQKIESWNSSTIGKHFPKYSFSIELFWSHFKPNLLLIQVAYVFLLCFTFMWNGIYFRWCFPVSLEFHVCIWQYFSLVHRILYPSVHFVKSWNIKTQALNGRNLGPRWYFCLPLLRNLELQVCVIDQVQKLLKIFKFRNILICS